MTCGIPAILIPFPYATADHQTYNAAEIVKSGAAQMIADSDLEKINLMERAVALVRSGDLQTMKDAALQLGRPEAATNIAKEILQLAWTKGEQFDRQGTHGAG
jgi:UDP-N-acetylglucosamine--N-acetylmuramyl-(pentapeptide) pyrophosphoryl-undecaprenol N-acetylglucosamine transferase